MKRLLVALTVVSCLAVVGCGGAKYADVKALSTQMADAAEKFVASLEQATEGEQVAAAMTEFAATMKKLAPQMQELQKKYPDLGNQKEPPPELKESTERLKAAMEKMMPVMMKKMMEHGNDPAVKKAAEDIGAQMQGLSK